MSTIFPDRPSYEKLLASREVKKYRGKGEARVMTTPPFDVERAHRWFAIELNNLTWGLVEAAERSPDDVEKMIHAAHGACFHWLQVGNLLNHLRAQCLLATVYAKAGLAESAVRHAEKCLQLSE